jgi:lysophospholipase L1-like esterase
VRRFLALGDSYTIGEGVSPGERWPEHLCAMLRARQVELADPEILARTAWTTDELWEAIAAADPRGPFDLVSLLAGVNDQYRGRPVTSFATEFIPLLRRAIGLAGRKAARVVVLSIPDWGYTPFAEGRDRDLITREIGAYNAAAREVVEKSRAKWIDITEESRAMRHDATLVATDGLHPSGAMYRRWAELVLPTAAAILAPEKRAAR